MNDDMSLSPLELMDDLDLHIMLILLQIMEGTLHVLRENVLHAMQHIRKEKFAASRAKPNVQPRRTFNQLANALSTRQFRRMFRMNIDSFDRLCHCIISKVGDDVFKSEDLLLGGTPTIAGGSTITTNSTAHAGRTKTRIALEELGGILSGELKLAIMLRLMAGASYLDVLVVFGVSTASVYSVFHEANSWVLTTFQFPLMDWVINKDIAALNTVASAFSSASDGVFGNCIGALDGIAIKIKAPCVSTMIPDPGNYFCRKGFYALNVQAICDKHKRVIWISTGHKGSTHDSVAFLETRLYKVLEENAEWLYSRGYFIVGDSAYPLMGHLMVPFTDAASQSPEDAFNFWLSNSRINIECAFGEIVMRWGILWRKLLFDIQDVGKIISVAALLHNFLVDERERSVRANTEDTEYFRNFSLREEDERANVSTEPPSAVVTDNNEADPGGRPSVSMINLQERGKQRREQLTHHLYGCAKGRPLDDTMKYNAYGQVYFS